MQNTDSIMELLSGYETYSTAQEVNLSAASEPPATTPVCSLGLVGATLGVASVSFGASYMGGQWLSNQLA